jgi:hypothetical protein
LSGREAWLDLHHEREISRFTRKPKRFFAFSQLFTTSQSEFPREAKPSWAVKLFETGKLFSGQAAQLAGIPRVHFQQ